MAELRLFNSRRAGGPSIILPIPGRNDVTISAEGDPENEGELLKDARGVAVEADPDRLRRQAASIRGLVVR